MNVADSTEELTAMAGVADALEALGEDRVAIRRVLAWATNRFLMDETKRQVDSTKRKNAGLVLRVNET